MANKVVWLYLYNTLSWILIYVGLLHELSFDVYSIPLLSQTALYLWKQHTGRRYQVEKSKPDLIYRSLFNISKLLFSFPLNTRAINQGWKDPDDHKKAAPSVRFLYLFAALKRPYRCGKPLENTFRRRPFSRLRMRNSCPMKPGGKGTEALL